MGNELLGGRFVLVVGGRVGRIMTGYSSGGRGAREHCVDQASSFMSWCDRFHNVFSCIFVGQKEVCWVGRGGEFVARGDVLVREVVMREALFGGAVC